MASLKYVVRNLCVPVSVHSFCSGGCFYPCMFTEKLYCSIPAVASGLAVSNKTAAELFQEFQLILLVFQLSLLVFQLSLLTLQLDIFLL